MFHNFLVNNGYVVLSIDFSGTLGYGLYTRRVRYRDACNVSADFAFAAKWLAKNVSVDPKRVGIYGGSAGGTTTWRAPTPTSQRP